MSRLSYNILFITFCITLALTLNLGFRLNSDEGVVLNGAWNLYNGKILYQDFFEFFGPASLYLINFVFIIFSPTYYSALFFSIAFLLISAYFLYRISIIILANVFWAKVSAVLWIILASFAYPIINHNSFSTFLTIIFTYFFLNLAKTKKEINGIIAGITAALIFYFLQTKGMAILFVGSIFLLLLKRKNIITKKNISSFYLAYFFTMGLGITLWGRHLIVEIFNVGSGYLQQNYYQLSLLPFMVFLDIFFLIIVILFAKKTINIFLGWLMAVQTGLIFSIFNLPDIFHILINSFPILILIIYLLKNLSPSRSGIYFIGVGLIVFLIVSMVIKF